jgi:hypothetical protein
MPLPLIQDIVFDYLAAERDKREGRVSVLDGLHSRVSSSGKCARAVAFQISGLEPTDPPSVDSLVNFYIGDAIHDAVQSAIISRWPDAQTETLGVIGDYLEGHSDVLYSAEDGKKVVCEIKSVSDFAFELATGATLKSNGRWRKKERVVEGPKQEHLKQAAIYAIMHDAEYVAIVYVRKTAAKNESIFWEWRYTLSELLDAAESEIRRHKDIVAMVRASRMPEREFEGLVIVDPSKVKWPCEYCSFRAACLTLGPGEIEIK